MLDASAANTFSRWQVNQLTSPIWAGLKQNLQRQKKESRQRISTKGENKMAAAVGERFNLKIGTHSSFLQMKARKWKRLESCLVWKSRVMNNVSVSIIQSVLIRQREQHDTCGLRDTRRLHLWPGEWQEAPCGREPPVVPAGLLLTSGRSGTTGKQTAKACDLNPRIRRCGESSWFTPSR